MFTYLVDLTVVTVALPYFFSACAQLTFLVSRRRRVQGWLFARDLLISVVSVLARPGRWLSRRRSPATTAA